MPLHIASPLSTDRLPASRAQRKRRLRRSRGGAILVLIAICLPVIVIMAAFAIDTAFMQLVRTELRTATDAASRAGAKVLSIAQTEPAARAAAVDAASRNLVAGDPLQLVNADIEVGMTSQASSTSRFVFTPGGPLLNAVRVNGRRTNGSASGPVGLFFGGVMGVGEFEPTHLATSSQLDRDICLIVDRSGSMMRDLVSRNIPSGSNCSPPHPTLSRWGVLAIAVEAFLAELGNTAQEETVGLVSYASAANLCGLRYTTSDINSDLTLDYNQIRGEMGAIGANPVRGRTSISAGIDNGRRVLTGSRTRPFAIKTMVLMTDGRHNTGREPLLSARECADDDITIHTITFSAEADLRRMIDVANATGGQHHHAPDAASLIQIYREIAKTLPVLVTD